MTKSEAYGIVWEEIGDTDNKLNEMFVDALIALGVLKVDEPVKYSGYMIKTVHECRSARTSTSEFLDALRDRGFQIVEK